MSRLLIVLLAVAIAVAAARGGGDGDDVVARAKTLVESGQLDEGRRGNTSFFLGAVRQRRWKLHVDDPLVSRNIVAGEEAKEERDGFFRAYHAGQKKVRCCFAMCVCVSARLCFRARAPCVQVYLRMCVCACVRLCVCFSLFCVFGAVRR